MLSENIDIKGNVRKKVGIMEKRLTKSEFMAKVINDKYKRRRAAKEKEYSADIHLIQNSRNIENFRFKREKYKFR